MSDDKWQKVREVFDSALRRPPVERRKIVRQACGNNKTLLAEVESLLSSLDSAEKFLETPAVAKVADTIEAETKQFEHGKCVGHYEIIAPIGAGGMGEIYLAKDKELDRQVAVKILNRKFAAHQSNLQRFIQEAKSASALNHPNILTIYAVGKADDTHFIVSEFIKGETLREILMEKTLKLPEVLDISIQIAGALCTAHEAHLVHRDIKPENIMLRPDGYVKILDFGLAKMVERKNKSIPGLDESTDGQHQTAQGVILGTINYMSPEQAKGERVDERTDIFSFGALIYEMIAGRTPFAGDSASETFANLINQEPPPLSGFAANVPDELMLIISEMLRKNKDERYQTMKGLLTDLKDLRENLMFDEKAEKSRPASENERATTVGANLPTTEKQNTFSQTIKRHKPLFALATAALLTGAIGLAYFFYAGKNDSRRVMNSREVQNVSLINRNSYNFALLQTNVTGRPSRGFASPNINANGYLRRINYLLDGNANTQGDRASVRLMIISEALVGEAQLLTNGFAAEFGNTPGIIMNVVTPSKLNEISGATCTNRMFPQFRNIKMVESAGNSRYSALNLQITQRFSSGLQFSANYSFSKATDDAPEQNITTGGIQNLVLSDPTSRALDKGRSFADQRHTFVMTTVFQPRFNSADKTFRSIFNNNQFGITADANSGATFNSVADFDLNRDGVSTSDRSAGIRRHARATPPQFNVDLRYSRFLNFTEHYKLEFFGEFQNLFNTNSIVGYNDVRQRLIK
jgi:serine/threonine protein kinase